MMFSCTDLKKKTAGTRNTKKKHLLNLLTYFERTRICQKSPAQCGHFVYSEKEI